MAKRKINIVIMVAMTTMLSSCALMLNTRKSHPITQEEYPHINDYIPSGYISESWVVCNSRGDTLHDVMTSTEPLKVGVTYGPYILRTLEYPDGHSELITYYWTKGYSPPYPTASVIGGGIDLYLAHANSTWFEPRYVYVGVAAEAIGLYFTRALFMMKPIGLRPEEVMYYPHWLKQRLNITDQVIEQTSGYPRTVRYRYLFLD